MNRRERAAYAKALASMKRWAREDRADNWTAEEWSGLVEKASSKRPAAPEPSRFPFLRPVVAAAAALALLVGAAVFLFKPRPANLSARNAAGPAEIAAPAGEDSRPLPEIASHDSAGRDSAALSRPVAPLETQVRLVSVSQTPRPREDKPAFTWISPETGLTIVWFTNKNLKLEDLP